MWQPKGELTQWPRSWAAIGNLGELSLSTAAAKRHLIAALWALLAWRSGNHPHLRFIAPFQSSVIYAHSSQPFNSSSESSRSPSSAALSALGHAGLLALYCRLWVLEKLSSEARWVLAAFHQDPCDSKFNKSPGEVIRSALVPYQCRHRFLPNDRWIPWMFKLSSVGLCLTCHAPIPSDHCPGISFLAGFNLL